MTTDMKTSRGAVDPLNRYGIADAARTRMTAQLQRNVTRPPQRQAERASVPNTNKVPKHS
jgi:hypothetical protein